jgi:nondiscriminating aspartyl-tRNA synthetase
MYRARNQRIFIQSLARFVHQDVTLRGWVYRLRVLGKAAFVILKDCSGEAQCVGCSTWGCLRVGASPSDSKD